MRVRILRGFSEAGKVYRAGDVVQANPEQTARWARFGLAMQDKSLDGAKETKAKPIVTPGEGRTRRPY